MLFRLGLATLALLMVASCSSTGAKPLNEALDSYLNGLEGLSGTILVAEGDQISFSGSYGLADEMAARPITDEDVWRWASVTKQLIGVLVMQEVEQGSLSLDTSISDLVPDFDYPLASDVSVKTLLKHTSGLPNPDRLESLSADVFDPEVFCSGKPEAQPGARFSYNNCDYYVLGRVLEASTGKSWDTVLRQRILQPLNMAQTAAMDSDLEETVVGYRSAGVLANPIDVALYGAAGAIYGNPRDLVKFNHGLMSGRLLTRESLAELWDGDPALGFVALGAWSFEAKLEGCPSMARIVERRGFIQGIQVRNFMLPQTGHSVVMFINRGDFDFGEVWMASGFSYDVLSRAVC